MSTDRPTVSVALATYNGARYLPALLDSLAAQTTLPKELVVTDDVSSDSTVEVLQRFARSAPFPVAIHRNPVRLGHEANFMRAASLTSGRFVAFCDQDDCWMPGKVQACLDAFDRPDPPSMVVHSAHVVGHDLAETVRVWPEFSRVERLRASDFTPLQAYFGCLVCFDRRLLDVIDPAYRPAIEPYCAGHDEWIAFLAAMDRGALLIPEPLVLYRQHDGNTFGAPAPEAEAAIHGSVRADLVAGRAKAVSAWARCLERAAAAGAVHADPARVAAWSAAHRDLARALEVRASMHAEPRLLRRVALWGLLVRRRSYGRRQLGGLGWQALVKDAVVVAGGPQNGGRVLARLVAMRDRALAGAR